MFRFDRDKVLTGDDLLSFIAKAQEMNKRFEDLRSWYTGKHPIFRQKKKEDDKPDNRIAVNFAKYITDTFNGFFIGNPISTSVASGASETIAKTVEFIEKYNDQDDNNAELAKLMSIYGVAYEMYFVDEAKQIGITYVDPREAFMIYDEGIVEEPLFFVHYYKNEDDELVGSISDEETIRYFEVNKAGEISFSGEVKHNFGGVPATEYIENEERMSLYESVISMMKAYDKAISEKANDVDYFSDAYLLIKGPEMDDKDTRYIKKNRTINLYDDFSEDGSALSGMDAKFIDKPNADATQEHLLEKLERLIYTTSMVPDVNSTTFGSSSGIAMQYKLFNVRNLFKTKVRKFTSGMNRRWKLIFSNPVIEVDQDDWVNLDYTFTPNIPANLQDEAQTASTLSGIVSKYTQLKILSCVDNVQQEMDRIEEEESHDSSMIQGLFDEHNHDEDVADDGEEEVEE